MRMTPAVPNSRADTLRRPHVLPGTAETTAFVRGRPYRRIRSPFDWLPLETQWPRSIELPAPRITMAPERRGGLVPNSRLPSSRFHFILGVSRNRIQRSFGVDRKV